MNVKESKHFIIAALVVAIITLFVFLPVLDVQFRIWDDDSHIYKNPTLTSLNWETLRNILINQSYSTCFYTPMTGLRWSLTRTLGGLNPRWFHLGNLLFHTANSVMVFVLAIFFSRIWNCRLWQETSPLSRAGIAVLAALLWSLHPLRVEAVAGAVCGAHTQALFFGLVSLLCYLKAVSRNKPLQIGWFIVSYLAYTISLLSQPILLALPLALVVIDFYPLKRFANGKMDAASQDSIRIIFEKIPYFLIAAVIAGINLSILPHSALPGHPLVSLKDFGIPDRIMQAFYIWTYYLWRPFFPFDLAPVYTTLINFDPWTPPFLTGAVTIIVSTILLVIKRRAYPALLAAWFSYLFLLIPFLGLTEHPHYPADRYSLTVAIIPSLLLAGWLLTLKSPISRFTTSSVILVLFIAAFGFLSMRQINVWNNTITLGNQMLKVTAAQPNHPYRAKIYRRMALHYLERNEYGPAAHYMRRALDIKPDEYQYANLLAVILINDNQASEAEAIFKKLIRTNPKKSEAYYNLAILLSSAGRYEEALAYAREVQRLEPENRAAGQFVETLLQKRSTP